ncbi:hypothetical protein EV191_11692 [Tamaricihabitans halophyticus]|uniref:Lon N-terminal domain-containing protein n=1 Tax=Tamaricihabitans halophyticus TaxID=1262583 RepID=A0A4R2QA34_9PSEU|nr:LON peptidase substrate-binding domain-containing protein [Tamaricihabitans halophyticus]TCP45449.1 hypothetical protein EV191_11692 [Tamaricihabitans halophyticus]
MVDVLPLFPLRTVLLPGTPLPLHIFEPRYRQLTVDLVRGTVPDRRFGVVAIRDAWSTEIERLDQVQEIGCSTVLRETTQLPDGRYDIHTDGQHRFRIRAIDAERKPYLMAEVEWLPDIELPSRASYTTTRLVDTARAAYERYRAAAAERSDWASPDPDTGPGELPYLLAADCLLASTDRQRLLAERHPLRRLRMVSQLLAMEAGLLSRLRAVPTHGTELAHHTSMN